MQTQHIHEPACHSVEKAKTSSDQSNHISHHEQHVTRGSLTGLTTAATLHCLLGCAIGEFIGLSIGVSLGFSPWATITLATLLGFASGYSLGLVPLVKQGNSWSQAFRTIWLGETISIAVMELTMNFTDYHVGGMTVSSILDLRFWLGYLSALPAGFIAAWPVNYWLLKRNVKQPCH